MQGPFWRMIPSLGVPSRISASTFRNIFLGLLGAFLLINPVSARADTISYSDSGTFSSSTPTSAFTAPNETWAFTFQADSNPNVLEFGNGGFNFAFSDFSYFLNGSPVSITPSFIRFFSPTNGGGFEICFNGTSVATCTDGLITGFSGPAMYSGTTSTPTLSPGVYGPYPFGFTVSSQGYGEANTTVDASAVPEPSSLALLSVAAGLLVFVQRRRLRLSS